MDFAPQSHRSPVSLSSSSEEDASIRKRKPTRTPQSTSPGPSRVSLRKKKQKIGGDDVVSEPMVDVDIECLTDGVNPEGFKTTFFASI